MSEFLFPTDGEWLEEYKKWQWESYDRERWDSDTILLHASRIFREHLSLPARFDYYAPERAALILGALHGKHTAIRHGALAFAAWMVHQKPRHILTSLMGVEICRGMHQLKDPLGIPDVAAIQIQSLLEDYALSEFTPSAGGIIAYWLKSTNGAIPLASWLLQQTS